MYLARNKVLAEQCITSYEDEVSYVYIFIHQCAINLSLSSVISPGTRLMGMGV
jgi:hypothetical protein